MKKLIILALLFVGGCAMHKKVTSFVIFPVCDAVHANTLFISGDNHTYVCSTSIEEAGGVDYRWVTFVNIPKNDGGK